MSSLEALWTPPPELLWGVISRGVALVFLVSFASLSGQVLPIAGKNGVTPVAEAFRAIERHFPTWKRFFYFPSSLWVSTSDAMLRALPWAGMLAASAAFVGGPWTPWAFAVCYLAYVSLDRPMSLVYPWDGMLFEAGFWGIFLPPTELLPNVAATAAPLPAVAWVFRLLAFRVMLGFGKHKFAGTTPKDSGFLRSFLVGQPLPTPIGILAQKLPLWMLKLGLTVMFLIEIPAPFFVFFPGPLSALAAVLTLLLMVGIWLTGNFGYFNLAMMVVVLSWFDTRTALAFSFADFFSSDGPVFVHALVLFHTVLALLAFPFNTFCAQTWLMWSPWTRVRPRFLAWPITVARLFQPLRTVHAYGVFPPHSPPAMKLAPVIEVSWDGTEWHTLTHRHAATLETSVPTFCAPHHDRFDQAVVYEALGLNESSVFRNIVGRWDPYGHGGRSGAELLLHRIVEGTVPGTGFFDRSLEKARGRPLVARVRIHMLEPVSLVDVRAGRWWKRTLVGPHFPPMRREDGSWDHPLPPPELWHFDDVIWLERSHLGRLMDRAVRGEDPHALVLADPDGITPDDVEQFWTAFLPAANPELRNDWRGLRKTVEELRLKFDRERLYRFERIAARYAVFLFAKLEPPFLDLGIGPIFGRGSAPLVKSNYHLRLLAYHVVGEGRGAYDAVMRDPTLSSEHASRLTMTSGNHLRAVFRYEDFVYQSQKLRLFDACLEQGGRPEPTEKQKKAKVEIDAIVRRLWGGMELVDFLKTQFTTDEDVLDIPERWPRFTVNERDEVVRIPAS